MHQVIETVTNYSFWLLMFLNLFCVLASLLLVKATYFIVREHSILG